MKIIYYSILHIHLFIHKISYDIRLKNDIPQYYIYNITKFIALIEFLGILINVSVDGMELWSMGANCICG